jgi:hypothetical protein
MKMKLLIALMALASAPAFASTTVLECRGSSLNGNARRIEIQGNSITVVMDDGSVMTGEDLFRNPNSGSINFNVVGFEYSVPKGLLNGRLKEADVGISSYDYPNESVGCIRQ